MFQQNYFDGPIKIIFRFIFSKILVQQNRFFHVGVHINSVSLLLIISLLTIKSRFYNSKRKKNYGLIWSVTDIAKTNIHSKKALLCKDKDTELICTLNNYIEPKATYLLIIDT